MRDSALNFGEVPVSARAARHCGSQVLPASCPRDAEGNGAMSMTGYLQRCSPALARRLQTDPSLASEIRSLALARSYGIAPLAETVQALGGQPEPPLGFERSWHVLHYLLTGKAWADEAAGAPYGGEPVGDDSGYGQALLYDAAATRGFAAFLARQSAGELLRRLDLPRMMELQIQAVTSDDPAARAAWAAEIPVRLRAMQAYVRDAALAGDGLLAWLS